MKIWLLILISIGVVSFIVLVLIATVLRKTKNHLTLDSSIKIVKNEMAKINGKFNPCNGIVVPHAAFRYCGILTALGFHSMDDTSVVLLWFRHGTNDYDNSYSNPHSVISRMGGNVVKSICVTKENWKDVAVRLNATDKLIVSSDFTHVNGWDYTKIMSNDMNVIDALIKDPSAEIKNPKPCGIYPLRAFMLWAKLNRFTVHPSLYHQSCTDQLGLKTKEGIWNRFQHKEEGYKVSYCVLGSYPPKTHPAQCKLISLSHTDWIISKIRSRIPPISWSPLLKKKGSVFITIQCEGKTYSCFGGWEHDNDTLGKALNSAIYSLCNRSWNENPPVKITDIRNCIVSVTWIDPKDKWIITKAPVKGKGHVVYNKNGHPVTFIPSVWDSIKRENYGRALMEKAGISKGKLWVYNSYTWDYNL